MSFAACRIPPLVVCVAHRIPASNTVAVGAHRLRPRGPAHATETVAAYHQPLWWWRAGCCWPLSVRCATNRQPIALRPPDTVDRYCCGRRAPPTTRVAAVRGASNRHRCGRVATSLASNMTDGCTHHGFPPEPVHKWWRVRACCRGRATRCAQRHGLGFAVGWRPGDP